MTTAGWTDVCSIFTLCILAVLATLMMPDQSAGVEALLAASAGEPVE